MPFGARAPFSFHENGVPRPKKMHVTSPLGKHFGRQVLMTLMGWATHVLQWRLQRDAMMRVGANL